MKKHLIIAAFLANIILIALHFSFGERFDLFHLDRERTFAAYYSGLQLFAVAAGGVVLTWLSRGRFLKYGWALFSSVFIFLGFDEISELHENITYYALTYGASIFNSTLLPFSGSTYNWLIIFSPFIVSAIIFFVMWAVRIPHRMARIYFSIGAALFVAAIGLELGGGFVKASPIPLFVIEEASELFGSTFFLLSVWNYALMLFFKQFERKQV